MASTHRFPRPAPRRREEGKDVFPLSDHPKVFEVLADITAMNQEHNAKLAKAALDASSIAIDAYCKANNIDVIDLTDERIDSFINAALNEVFSPHTKMSEICKGWTQKTLGEVTSRGD
jgi:hypothetical protein